MKLYRLTVIGGQQGLDRGVWANKFEEDAGAYRFYVDGKLIASYPVSRTIIVNIETKEDFDKRKAEEETQGKSNKTRII
jgi:hypothetical protein